MISIDRSEYEDNITTPALNQRLSQPIFFVGLFIAIFLIMAGQIGAAMLIFFLGSCISAAFKNKPDPSSDDIDIHAINNEFANRDSLSNPTHPARLTNPDGPNNPLNFVDHQSRH